MVTAHSARNPKKSYVKGGCHIELVSSVLYKKKFGTKGPKKITSSGFYCQGDVHLVMLVEIWVAREIFVHLYTWSFAGNDFRVNQVLSTSARNSCWRIPETGIS